MRLVEALQITAAVIGPLATGFMALEQRLVGRFRREAAISAEAAIELPRVSAPTRWRLARLRSVGAVVVSEDGRSYLDEAVYLALRKKRALRGVGLVVFLIATVVLVRMTWMQL